MIVAKSHAPGPVALQADLAPAGFPGKIPLN